MRTTDTLPMTLFSDSTLDTIAKVAGSVTAVTAACVTFGKWIAPWAARRLMVKDAEKGIMQLNALHETMEEAIAVGAAHRVIVFSAHNSGGIPKPGSPFYASAIHWAIDRQWARSLGFEEEKLKDYSHLELDHSYIAILVHMMTNGERRFTTVNEPAGLLKSIYEKTGVTDALLVYLGVYDKRLFYASFARYGSDISDTDLTVMRLKAGIMRQCLRDANA